jgi:hypothetical protein
MMHGNYRKIFEIFQYYFSGNFWNHKFNHNLPSWVKIGSLSSSTKRASSSGKKFCWLKHFVKLTLSFQALSKIKKIHAINFNVNSFQLKSLQTSRKSKVTFLFMFFMVLEWKCRNSGFLPFSSTFSSQKPPNRKKFRFSLSRFPQKHLCFYLKLLILIIMLIKRIVKNRKIIKCWMKGLR